MYDLDKTQEWLNRTIQLNQPPPVRGGSTTDPHARRDTAASVACAVLVIALGILLVTWLRTGSAGPGSSVVVVDGRVPEPQLKSGHYGQADVDLQPIVAAAPTIEARHLTPRSRPRWLGSSLDGNIVPLPGYSPPPAPVWLDGAAR